MIPRTMFLPAGLLLLGLFLYTGCDSDENVCGPGVPAARLAGRVNTGSDPTLFILQATRTDLPEGESGIYSATPDADGHYAVDVPPGRYVLELRGSIPAYYSYTAFGPALGRADGDTLQVTTGQIIDSLDFDLATLALHIVLPDSALDGESVVVSLHREGSDDQGWDPDFRWQQWVGIEGGTVDYIAPAIPPGRYQVEFALGARRYECICSYPWDGEHVWLPDGDTREQAAWYEAPAGQVLDLAWSTGTPPARLTGTIGGAWRPLGMNTPPEISIIDTDSMTVMGQRRTEEDGSFDLILYRPRPVKLLVTHMGVPQYIGGPDFASATVFAPAAGQAVTGITLESCAVTLDTSLPLGAISGQADFHIYTADGQILLGTVSGQWCFKSTYILPNLWPGAFLVKADFPGSSSFGRYAWIPQWYPGVADLADAEPVVLSQPGEVLPLTMTVLEGGSIAGELTGEPDPDDRWHVLATTADEAAVWGSNDIFGPETAYNLIGLPDGDWKVGVTPIMTPGDTIWYPGTTDWSAATAITIENGSAVEGIDIPVD